jgi:Fur family transcriptional regulator, peroxide stress response regulator
MNNLRYSKQRDLILKLLKSTDKHPSADWIYEKLREEISNISVGTVYRNLNILISLGLVKKIDFNSNHDRFDANMDNHYHFICENCGEIIDIDVPVEIKVDFDNRFKVKFHNIQFYGICENCSKKDSK